MEEQKVRQLKTDDRNIEREKTFWDDPGDVHREIWGFQNAELKSQTDSLKQGPNPKSTNIWGRVPKVPSPQKARWMLSLDWKEMVVCAQPGASTKLSLATDKV